MKTKERNVSLDVLKIISCFGIVAIHTINGSLSPITKAFVLMCSICIPMFILVNGYLMFSKSEKAEITYPYVFRKIGRILLVCLCWELLNVVKVFVLERELYPFWKSYFLNFIQDGYFFQFWFFGTLMAIYLILPLLSKLYRKSKKAFVAIFVTAALACVAVTVASIAMRYPFQLDVIQTFRFWTWIFFFTLGGVLVFTHDKWMSFVSHHKFIVAAFLIVSLAGTIAWQWIVGAYFGRAAMECFYQDVPIMISVVLLFVLISGIEIKNETAKLVIGKLSMCTMGIYILHPDALEIVRKLVPAFGGTNVFVNIFFCIAVFVICLVISFAMIHIPVIKYLVSL